MESLRNKFKDKVALNIMGGPSILKNKLDLSKIDKSKYTVFLESKALTPKFLQYKLEPDFFLMFYPEKCQTNAFQHLVYQSFLIDMDIEGLLKPEFALEYKQLRNNFDQYFESWRPERGLHKKYRLRPGVALKNSPFDLLPHIPKAEIIAQEDYVHYPVEGIGLKNKVYFFKVSAALGGFSLEKYYNPQEVGGKLVLNGYGHLNSAAISLFPLQKYMGFKKIYFIGMDM
ncbi:hypothetical protein EPO66_00060, partial [bacterium]